MRRTAPPFRGSRGSLRAGGAAAALALAGLALAPGARATEIELLQRPHTPIPNLVRVSVGGGAPALVTFDTGSGGLRILESAVGPQIRPAKTRIRETYGDGTVLEGYLGYARVALPTLDGGEVSTGEIPVQIVTRVTCLAQKPNCPGLGEERVGIMGVDYATRSHVFNPLAQLPGPLGAGYIVDVDPAAPRVHLGLPPEAIDGFRFLPLAPAEPAVWPIDGVTRGWSSASVKACFEVEQEGAPPLRQCVPTLFDTGSTAMRIEVPDAPPEHPGFVPAGREIRVEVPGALRWTFHSEGHHDVSVGYGPRANAGERFFRHFRVAFDGAGGRIGFARREDTPGAE